MSTESLFFKYIYRLFARSFLFSTTLIVMMMWIIQFASIISLMTSISLKDVKVFIYPIPYILFRLIPMISLISCTSVCRKLRDNGTIVAMAGLGMSAKNFQKPIMRFALFITLSHALLSFFILPFSYSKILKADKDLKIKHASSLIRSGWIRDYNNEILIDLPKDGSMQNIVIVPDKSREEIIIADEGDIELTDCNMVVDMNNVFFIGEDNTFGKIKKFSLRLRDNSLMENIGIKIKSSSHKNMQISELFKRVRHSKEAHDVKQSSVALFHRVLWPLYSFSLFFILVKVYISEKSRNRLIEVLAVLVSFIMIIAHYILQESFVLHDWRFTFILLPFIPHICYAFFACINKKEVLDEVAPCQRESN